MQNLTKKKTTCEPADAATLVECIIYYVQPDTMGAKFIGSKERKRVPMDLSPSCSQLDHAKKQIKDHTGIDLEAAKRGLGTCVDISISRIEKQPDSDTRVYSISTDAAWKTELPEIRTGSSLQGGPLISANNQFKKQFSCLDTSDYFTLHRCYIIDRV